MMLPKSMMHLSLVILCLLIQTGMIFGLSFQKQKLSLSRKTIASSPLPTPSAAVTATTVQKEIKENKLDYKGTSLTVLLTALLMGSISPEPAHADVTTWIQPIFPNPDTYWKYFFSGAISASLSHGVTVPFDVVKTKIQTSSSASDSGKKVGLLSYAKTLVEQEGVGVLLTGKF